MELVAQTNLTQRIRLTPATLHSLRLLEMGPRHVAETVESERRRNPFLKMGSPFNSISQTGLNRPGNTSQAGSAEESPRDRLARQIGTLRLTPEETALARDLVHCIDDQGVFADGPDDTSKLFNIPGSLLRRVVRQLQTLNPPGVFAWSLPECFRLQLRARNRHDPFIEKLLSRLDLVATRDLEGICNCCGVDREDAEEMVNDIRALTRLPLAEPRGPIPNRGEPDLLIFKDPHGRFVACLNEAALPTILTDDAYFSARCSAAPDNGVLAYYRELYSGAARLVAALQRRANTLLDIGNHLASSQAEFLRTGALEDRIALTRRDTASVLGISTSTVSRAMKECRIQTPHGTKAAGNFFVRRISRGGSFATRDRALQCLKSLVDAEDPSQPLSDESLSRCLKQSGFMLSRRAVANYRKLLCIPNAGSRRASRRHPVSDSKSDREA